MWAVNMLPVRALPASGRFGGCGGAQPMLCRPDMAGRCGARRDPIPSPHAVQGESHPRGQVLVDPRASTQGIGNSPAGRCLYAVRSSDTTPSGLNTLVA
jgi:hypothetical protein